MTDVPGYPCVDDRKRHEFKDGKPPSHKGQTRACLHCGDRQFARGPETSLRWVYGSDGYFR